jgi:hypothetical protein
MKLEDVILRGLRIDQPSFLTVPEGTLYYVQDEFKTERSSGTAWELYSGQGTFIISRGITVQGIITTGVKGVIRIPNTSTIVKWTVMSDVAGTIEFNIRKSTPPVYPPVTSIVAAAPPALVADDFDDDTTLTGWTTAVLAGDVLQFEVTSVNPGMSRVTLQVDLLVTPV